MVFKRVARSIEESKGMGTSSPRSRRVASHSQGIFATRHEKIIEKGATVSRTTYAVGQKPRINRKEIVTTGAVQNHAHKVNAMMRNNNKKTQFRNP